MTLRISCVIPFSNSIFVPEILETSGEIFLLRNAYTVRKQPVKGGQRMTVGYYILMFALGLVLLVWGSGLFVDSAVALANRFRLPEVLIGATIVSLGTTLPETLFSTMASVKELSDMALGNALGSILCNTGFIAGTLIFLRPVLLNPREVRNVRTGLSFLGTAFVLYMVCGYLTGGLSRTAGIVLLCLCVMFFLNSIRQALGNKYHTRLGTKRRKCAGSVVSARETAYSSEALTEKPPFGISDIIRLILEAGVISIGAGFLVEYGPKLARVIHVPESIISLTFVALGTSLPELVTSLTALRKKHSSLSLGNIIGADILNFVLVGGLSAVIRPIAYTDSVMKLELPFIFLVLFLMCVPSIIKKKAGRIQGALLLGSYILYLSVIW